MALTPCSNDTLSNKLSAVLRRHTVEHTKVIVTDRVIIIHGAWNHLPRVRPALCEKFNLRFVKAVDRIDKGFSLHFERL